MKSIFKISIALLLLCTGCNYIDEEQEFIQLEKKLADIAVDNDEDNFYNIYTITFDGARFSQYTDSLIAISKLYDSLIFKEEQANYDSEFEILFNAIHRIENRSENYFGNKHVDDDSIFMPAPI